ncbi:hypothetical protein NUACC21_19350 [Scytonema sp. NUACC21]
MISIEKDSLNLSNSQLPPRIRAPKFLQYLWGILQQPDYLEKMQKRYGDIFISEFAGFPTSVVISNPQGIQEVFTADAKLFETGPGNSIMQPLVGLNSLILLDGDRHIQRRKLLMPPFHGERMRAYGHLMCAITEKVMSPIQIGKTFVARKYMQEISLIVILRAVFGLEEGERYQQIKGALNAILTSFETPSKTMVLFFKGLQHDLGSWSPWGYFLRQREALDKLIYQEIQERRNQPDSSREDILNLLLSARDDVGQPMTDVELRDELMSMLFAGHETTATALSWALYWIHNIPEVREKLLQELNSIDSAHTEPTEIAKLPYLSAVCSETLRMYPVVFFTQARILQAPMRLIGYEIPKGMMLAPCIYLTHHRPDIYQQPKQFKPVTGGSVSNIDGLIRANGNANLFLLNPNGIIFGRNAELNIGGSFVASTASSLKFADGAEFSALAPQTTPLLTVSVPIGLQYGETAGSIRNLSQATNNIGELVGLEVEPSKTLALVGGYVELDGGILQAPGGQVELGGLAQLGTVALNFTGNNLSLNFPQNVQRADVSLINSADVNVLADGGGSIAINAQNLNMGGGSRLQAGINSDLGSIGSQAGNVEINATGIVNINDSSIINALLPRSVGKGGDINITTGSLAVTNGAQVAASTLGQGNAGNLTILARNTVSFDGKSSNGLSTSAAFSTVESGAVGKGGNINITTGSLSLTNEASLNAATRGQGDAGSVKIDARDIVTFDGGDIFTNVVIGAVGTGGNINITTGSLSISNGAQLVAGTNGQGNAGNVTINARDTVSLDSAVDKSSTAVFSTVGREAVGKGGNINITTGSLSLTNGSNLVTSTFGQGDAGNVMINARDTVSLAGVKSSSSRVPSAVFSTVEREAVGKGGNINITTGSLSLTNGAQISVANRARQGNAGNVVINARDKVFLDGVGSNKLLSAVFSSVEREAVGNGGNINITTGSLFLTNGARLTASTLGQGDAGNVVINARDAVFLDGVSSNGFSSAVLSALGQGAVGKSGNINITTGSFSMTNGAQLIASTDGQGDAGNINITTGLFSMTNGAQLFTSTSGQGDAGNVVINAYNNVSLDSSSAVFSAVEREAVGKGGNIDITTRSLSLTNGAQLITTTFAQGNAGNIQIRATEAVKISGTDTKGLSSALFTLTAPTSTGTGGSITVDAGVFYLSNGALLDTRTSNNRKGGDITVNARSFEVFNGGQMLTITEGSGRAGKITVNATKQVTVSGSDATFNDRVAQFGTDVRNLGPASGFFVQSERAGIAGDIEVTAPSIFLNDQGRLIAESASGNGGNIILGVQDLLLLRRGSIISTTAGTAQQPGDGGNITINTPNGFIVAVPSEDSNISANAFTGKGGRVDITAQGIFGIQSRPSLTSLSDITASSEFGIDGTVELNTPDVNLSSGLVNLPAVPVDTQVAQACTAGSSIAKSKFTIAGRGGLPPNPGEALNTDAVQVDLVTLNPEVAQSSTPAVSTNPTSPTPARIVEATGWVIDADGNVVFTANPTTIMSHSSWQRIADCRAFNQQPGG